MQAYCIHTVVTQSGAMTLKNLPFRPGEDVEVIIVRRMPQQPSPARNDAPLRAWYAPIITRLTRLRNWSGRYWRDFARYAYLGVVG